MEYSVATFQSRKRCTKCIAKRRGSWWCAMRSHFRARRDKTMRIRTSPFFPSALLLIFSNLECMDSDEDDAPVFLTCASAGGSERRVALPSSRPSSFKAVALRRRDVGASDERAVAVVGRNARSEQFHMHASSSALSPLNKRESPPSVYLAASVQASRRVWPNSARDAAAHPQLAAEQEARQLQMEMAILERVRTRRCE